MPPEYLDKAKEELKRVDHLIFVSLKYTRTVDVIKSIIVRLLNCYDFLIDGILQNAKDRGKIDHVPSAPVVKCEVLQKLYKSDLELGHYCNFYLLLRKINRANFERAREFRRHVTMTALVEEKEIEIDIDIISDYFKHVKLFVDYLAENIIKQS